MPFNKLNHAHLGEIRPRFKLIAHCSVEDAITIIEENLQKDKSVVGRFVVDHIHFKIPMDNRHYWSPELHINFDKSETNDYIIVRCLVGPKQSVWAMFAFFYAFLGLATIFGGMFGLSQWQLGHPPYFLWSFVGLLIIPSIYTFAKIGQKKGRNQMLHLISFLYHSLEEKGVVERHE